LAKSSWQWFAVVTRHSITQSSNLPALTPVRQVIQSFNHSITHNVGSWQKAVGNGLPS